jgi:adenylate cyclase
MEESSFTGTELADRARVAPELVGRLVELGILRPGEGEAPFGLGDARRARLAVVQRIHEASGLGRPQPDDPPLLGSGMDEQQMREAASQMSDQLAGVVQRMLLAIYTRHQERYTIDHLVEHIESVVTERRPQRPPAMCFLDLAGYTRLNEERRDRAAAALATSLADLVEQVSLPHGVQPVKWLGDGVMFHFRRSGQAVAALEMVERTPLAGPVPLKGVTAPVPLHRATRAARRASGG